MCGVWFFWFSLFLLWLEYLSKLPFLSLQIEEVYLCFVTLSNLNLRIFFHSPSCFLLPCLSLVFFPVSFPWQLSFIYAVLRDSHPLLSASVSAPPPMHITPAPFPFCSISLLCLCVCILIGTEKKFELTPVAAISVHLLASDGVELQVNGPITISVPLPADGTLKESDHIPAWRFDPRLGMYKQKWIISFLWVSLKKGFRKLCASITQITPKSSEMKTL